MMGIVGHDAALIMDAVEVAGLDFALNAWDRALAAATDVDATA